MQKNGKEEKSDEQRTEKRERRTITLNPEIEKRVKDGLHIPSDSSLNAEELRGGLSGAEVYRVNAENSQYNPFKGYYIVKVCPSDERIGGEQQTAYDLWQTAPQKK